MRGRQGLRRRDWSREAKRGLAVGTPGRVAGTPRGRRDRGPESGP